MSELRSGQQTDTASDAEPLQDSGYLAQGRVRADDARCEALAEPQTRAQYTETTRRADDLGDQGDERNSDSSSVEEGMHALVRFGDSRHEMAEPRTRQDAAAEDRALDQRAGSDDAGEDTGERTDVASRYPDEYIPSADHPPDVDGPHQSPETWITGINPGQEMSGRNNNCGECSRAVDNTWEGEPAVAAALADPDSVGEPTHRMADWAGTAPVKASMDDVGQRLADLGPGCSAIVGCDWVMGGGHWFNAINDEGTVKAVDGQSGKIENWPPSAEGLGFDESTMRWSDAIFFTADGKTIKP